eukprot:9476183-Pyramimonas_sp.AAC.1
MGLLSPTMRVRARMPHIARLFWVKAVTCTIRGGARAARRPSSSASSPCRLLPDGGHAAPASARQPLP